MYNYYATPFFYHVFHTQTILKFFETKIIIFVRILFHEILYPYNN